MHGAIGRIKVRIDNGKQEYYLATKEMVILFQFVCDDVILVLYLDGIYIHLSVM